MYLSQYHRLIIALGIVAIGLVMGLVTYSSQAIGANQKYVVTPDAAPDIRIGLVLGAGVTKEGKPYKELQARLDSAADALQAGIVDKLILSGDNRFDHYDEPTAMLNYMVNQRGIDTSKLQPDFAGRSTYESCERAAKIFQLKQVIIFSAGSHLPRAIYLCRHFGVEAYGISSGVEANNSGRRELLARVKAVYNVSVLGEKTILGDPIPLQ